MSKLTIDTTDLTDEGLDIETVNLEASNLETESPVNLEGGELEVGIGGGGQDGRGIASIEQTVTSTEDGGINEVTQTLTDGTTAVFQIRNGQRGSQGIQGERGLQGERGEQGIQGIQGERGEKGDAGEDWIPTQQELASIASSAAALVNVPTKTSDLTNDSNFVDEGYVIRNTANMAAAILNTMGQPNGIASLDANGKVPSSQLPSSGGEANVIEVVKVNGTALTPDSNKAVDVLIPSWAMQSSKPTYTASEVGALPASTTIPSALADLSADSTHRVVTDTEKATWNGKSNFSGSYTDLADKPTIPSALADLSDDSTHRTVTDTEKATWNAKGTYSKPSGGIPASDIASGVIPTVPTTVSSFSNDAHYVASTAITTIVSMTQAQYDALASKDSNTLYVII